MSVQSPPAARPFLLASCAFGVLLIQRLPIWDGVPFLHVLPQSAAWILFLIALMQLRSFHPRAGRLAILAGSVLAIETAAVIWGGVLASRGVSATSMSFLAFNILRPFIVIPYLVFIWRLAGLVRDLALEAGWPEIARAAAFRRRFYVAVVLGANVAGFFAGLVLPMMEHPDWIRYVLAPFFYLALVADALFLDLMWRTRKACLAA